MLSICCLVCVFLASGVVDGHAFSPQAQSLMGMSQFELDQLFLSSSVGAVPNGRGYGMIMLRPSDAKVDLDLWLLGKQIWQGKVFDAQGMTGINVILGQHLVKGKLSVSPSAMDQQQSIILNFSALNPEPPMNHAHDEFRQIGDNLYLGRMYLDGSFLLSFALEWEASQSSLLAVPMPVDQSTFPVVDGHVFSDFAQSLMKMHQSELDSLFKSLEPGPVPDGRGYGMIMLAPVQSDVDMALWDLGKLAWQGKVFDAQAQTVVNVVFEQNFVKGQVKHNQSVVDGRQSLILDFGAFNKLPPTNGIHDELRQISKNLYIGRMYMYGRFTLNFALEFCGSDSSAGVLV